MSRVVFVGNIPFEMSEEQMIDIFKEVGPVLSFKLMFDRETGKPRGFGFCEYADVETANSAIRNLNGYDIGGRTLKVGYADHEMPGSKPNQMPNLSRPSPSQIPTPLGFPPSAISTQHLPFPPPPPPHIMMRPPILSPNGQTVFPNHPPQMMMMTPTTSIAAASQQQPIKPTSGLGMLSAPPSLVALPPSVEAINGIMSSMSNAQLVELITQLKNMAVTSPEQARIFLNANPALSYALLQALLATNLVDPVTAQQLLASIPSQTAETTLSSSSHPNSHQVKSGEEKSAPASANVHNNPPSTPHLLDKERQQALIAQILSMTPEQIDLLPPEQRDQILMIRAQLQHQQQSR